jgi:hypothetical protein
MKNLVLTLKRLWVSFIPPFMTQFTFFNAYKQALQIHGPVAVKLLKLTDIVCLKGSGEDEMGRHDCMGGQMRSEWERSQSPHVAGEGEDGH